MRQQEGVLVRVPASTANLGPGFDSLGMALHLHLWIAMRSAEATVIRLHGKELAGIPTDESNVIYRAAQSLFLAAGVEGFPIEVDVYSEIPVTRGLGSSAAAIVGGLYAANTLIGHPLTREQLFNMATQIEGHPDNVGASLIGGIIVAVRDGARVEYIRIEPHRNLCTMVAIPQFHLDTNLARQVLPNQVSMADAVFNISRASLLVAALSGGQFDRLALAMRDCLHQPYRAPSIPGMSCILEGAVLHGALGVALSGAGPTLLAFTDRCCPSTSLLSYMKGTLLAYDVAAKVMELEISREGAVCCGTWSDLASVLAKIF